MPTWRNFRRARLCTSACEQPHEALEALAVRWPEEAQQVEPWLAEDRLALGERLESRAAMVFAHAARADAAEGQVVLRDVQQRLVHGHAARNRLLEHAVD